VLLNAKPGPSPHAEQCGEYCRQEQQSPNWELKPSIPLIWLYSAFCHDSSPCKGALNRRRMPSANITGNVKKRKGDCAKKAWKRRPMHMKWIENLLPFHRVTLQAFGQDALESQIVAVLVENPHPAVPAIQNPSRFATEYFGLASVRRGNC